LWLKLRAFRGFKNLVLELPKEGPAVLIGVNGAGKSTLLEAMAMHLSSFAALVTGVPAGLAEVRPSEADIKAGDESAGLEVMLRVGQDEQVWELRANRARGFAYVDKLLTEQAAALREGLSRTEGASVPVLCFYPATRGLNGSGAPSKRSPPVDHRLEVYEHAFSHGSGSFQDFIQWFRDEEDAENEGRLRIDPGYRNPRLEVARRALERFLSGLGESHFSNLRMDRLGAGESPKGTTKTAELVLDKEGVRLRIQQFSEGERNTILLVTDLARRLAIANPSQGDPLQGEGIVLIDEIDLHLHPAWQRGILPALCATFPACQFIVSTHSPQALSCVTRENVFILENFELVRVTPHTYGRDTNSILAEVMGLPERPKDIAEKIRKASRLVDEERLDEAKIALHELTSILGDQDNVVVRLRTLVSFLDDRS
jgi:predicted ATP-binding protein involved in virulence